MKLTPHFTFDGQSEEAMNFYSTVFSGKIVSLIRCSDIEDGCCGTTEMKSEDPKRIYHGCLQFGENVIYCCDQKPGEKPIQGNYMMMDLTLSDKVEVQRVFICRYHTFSLKLFARWFLSFADKAEILEPLELKDIINELIGHIQQLQACK